MGYCCILLPQIRSEGKILSSQVVCHAQQGLQMCLWRDIIAGSSAPISLIQNLFSQNQHEIASTGKQIILVGRPGVLSQSLASLPSFRFRLSVVYQKSLNVSEQNCNVYWSKDWIQLTPKLMCAIYSTPKWGAADAEIIVPSGENTELKRSPFKALSMSQYSHACFTNCQGFLPWNTFFSLGPFTFIFAKPLPSFQPRCNPLWLTGLQAPTN